jgi:hypothetical protein
MKYLFLDLDGPSKYSSEAVNTAKHPARIKTDFTSYSESGTVLTSKLDPFRVNSTITVQCYDELIAAAIYYPHRISVAVSVDDDQQHAQTEL